MVSKGSEVQANIPQADPSHDTHAAIDAATGANGIFGAKGSIDVSGTGSEVQKCESIELRPAGDTSAAMPSSFATSGQCDQEATKSLPPIIMLPAANSSSSLEPISDAQVCSNNALVQVQSQAQAHSLPLQFVAQSTIAEPADIRPVSCDTKAPSDGGSGEQKLAEQIIRQERENPVCFSVANEPRAADSSVRLVAAPATESRPGNGSISTASGSAGYAGSLGSVSTGSISGDTSRNEASSVARPLASPRKASSVQVQIETVPIPGPLEVSRAAPRAIHVEPAVSSRPTLSPGSVASPDDEVDSSQRVVVIRLESIDADESFRLRPDGDIDSLATSIVKLGQLFPIDLRQRSSGYQIVTGFRRVAALRLLKRETVLARVHKDLRADEALRMGLADLLEQQGAEKQDLEALRERLRQEHRLTAPIRETLDQAISPPSDALGPETINSADEEVDLDELTRDLIGRLASINQDLSLVVELWNVMDPALRDALFEQLGYPEQLVSYLRRRDGFGAR